MDNHAFSIDLTDLTACGVYFVTPDDIDTLAASAGGDDDFNVHRVSLSGCHESDALAARMAASFSLPSGHDRSWSHLIAYLQDMDGLPSRGHITLFHEPDAWRANDPSGFDAVLDALEETAAIWANEGVAFFVFIPEAEEAGTPTSS